MTADHRRALFLAAAKAIAGSDNPPAWLTEGIPDIVYILEGNVDVENAMPEREEWRKRFKKTAEYALFLHNELQDYKGFLPMLLNDSTERLPYEGEMLQGLKALVIRCEERLASLHKKQGVKKYKAKIDKTPDGKVLCALAVGLAWEPLHKEWPGVQNKAAYKACQKLWKAAGGDKDKREPASGNWVPSWRRYLEKSPRHQR